MCDILGFVQWDVRTLPYYTSGNVWENTFAVLKYLLKLYFHKIIPQFSLSFSRNSKTTSVIFTH